MVTLNENDSTKIIYFLFLLLLSMTIIVSSTALLQEINFKLITVKENLLQ